MMSSLVSRLAAAILIGQTLLLTATAAITSVSATWNGLGNATNANPPQVEALPLGEESWAFVTRTHELTSARYDAISGLLTVDTNSLLVGFPNYLLGAQYVANANENRTAGETNNPLSYTVSYTVTGPSAAYLLIDNRMDGTGSNATGSSQTTDPDLGGSMAWVINDGWQRVNTGIMPNGQPDYLGIDEGRTVASPDLRDHTGSGLVAGPGNGLNQFYSIYTRILPEGGTFETRGIRQNTGAGNMYVVAVVAIPEPATWALLGLGALGMAFLRRRQ